VAVVVAVGAALVLAALGLRTHLTPTPSPGGKPALTEAQQAALAQLEQAASSRPTNAMLQQQLSSMYLSAGRESEACQVLQRLCQANPTDLGNWLTLGDLQMKLEHYGAAADAYGHAVALGPHNVTALCALAQADLTRGHSSEVESLVRRAEQSDPRSAVPHFVRGQLLLRSAMADVAIPEFQRAVALQPDYMAGWLALAVASLQAKQWSVTADACRHAARLDPHNSGVLSLWAQASLERGLPQDEAEARRLAEAALRINPQDAGSHYIIGVLELRASHLDAAIGHLEAALQADPSRLDVRTNLLKAYQRAGRSADADHELKVLDAQTEYQRQVDVLIARTQVQPNDARLRLRLGDLYASVGKRRQARVEYERALDLDPKLEPARAALHQLGE